MTVSISTKCSYVSKARLWWERTRGQQCEAENATNNNENKNKDKTSVTEQRVTFNTRHSRQHKLNFVLKQSYTFS